MILDAARARYAARYRRRDHATAQIAVVDPLPLFADGVARALSAAGHRTETPTDVVSWVGRQTSALVLLTLTGALEWHLLTRLRAVAAEVPVVALVDADTARRGVRAVRAGARSVLPRDVAADVLRRAVDATMDGQAVLPAAAATLLAAAAPAEGADTIPADRLDWLRVLASGGTVAQLAARAGYSERAMFRLLRDLYREMGAGNRMDAIMLARDRGWV